VFPNEGTIRSQLSSLFTAAILDAVSKGQSPAGAEGPLLADSEVLRAGVDRLREKYPREFSLGRPLLGTDGNEEYMFNEY
jgi:hypothetical protein